MNFKEAMVVMKEGYRVTRKEWGKVYLQICDNEVKSYPQERAPFIYDNTIFGDEKWCEVGKEETFSFIDAIDLLKQGKKLKLTHWMDDSFIILDGKQLLLAFNCQFEYMVSFECLSANDWEIVK